VQARVDQVEPPLQVNPVAGFLLPDHLDESLEVFGVDGSPLGELLHEAVSGGVTWEIAAGREGPADAAPMFGLAPSQFALGRLASGLVAADAAARGGVPLSPPRASRANRRSRRCCARSTRRCGPSTRWPRSAASTSPGSSAGPSPSCARSSGSS
jgi:hypothetical protein